MMVDLLTECDLRNKQTNIRSVGKLSEMYHDQPNISRPVIETSFAAIEVAEECSVES